MTIIMKRKKKLKNKKEFLKNVYNFVIFYTFITQIIKIIDKYFKTFFHIPMNCNASQKITLYFSIKKFYSFITWRCLFYDSFNAKCCKQIKSGQPTSLNICISFSAKIRAEIFFLFQSRQCVLIKLSEKRF